MKLKHFICKVFGHKYSIPKTLREALELTCIRCGYTSEIHRALIPYEIYKLIVQDAETYSSS